MAKAKSTKTEAAAPAVNLFAAANAAPVTVKTAAEKKSKKTQVAMGSDLDRVAAIDNIMKALEARKAVYEASVKASMKNYFVVEGLRRGQQPENFEGVGEKSTASCELRKRSTASKLNAEEQKLLKDNNIPFTEVADIDIPERFFFNEEILTMGPEVLQQISAALLAIPALKGKEVLKVQPAQKESKFVTTDETIDAVCALKDMNKITELLTVVGTMAIKPKLNADVAITSAFDDIRSVLSEKPATKTEDL
jgi:hypothetical protein